MELSPLRQLRMGRLPKMVSWYDPRLLARIGVRTVISSVFGQYADQRLMQAVTDTAGNEELCGRYDYENPNATDPNKCVVPDESGAYWIDYVADVGDGFESTYAMAYLLAQDNLNIRGPGRLRHGDVLIMGGDQCYPQATREEYRKRLVRPFDWAFNTDNPSRKLFAIPGNHDWYDGLTAFDSLFCSSRDKLSAKGNAIGGWQCQQHRSYWALHLPYNWWIWGADIQFSKYLDTAQVNYFEAVAERMSNKDNLIICLAEPSWMLADLQGQDEEENFFKITTIARKRGAHVRAVIAGDWHHYSRYYLHELDIHFITSGGGGAFLHPTHVLRNSISVRWPERDEGEDAALETSGLRSADSWKAREYDIRLKRHGKAAENVVEQAMQDVQDAIEPLRPDGLGLKRKRQPLKPQAPKCYPDKGRSYLLSLGNVFFPFYNPAFAIGIGIVYWIITWQFQSLVAQHHISSFKIDNIGIGTTTFWSVLKFMPLYVIQAMLVSISLVAVLLALYGTLVWYVDAIERPGFRRYATKFLVGTSHFAAHVTAMFVLSLLVVMLNNWVSPSIERAVTTIRQTQETRTGLVRDVIQETIEPLERQEERQAAEQRQRPTQAADTPPQATPVRNLVGFISYPTMMIILGALVGGSLWGLYWVLTGLFGRMHAEDAFAALRIKNYKNFLRLKFEQDKLTIYPLGIDKMPGPDHWLNAPKGRANPLPSNPKLIAVKPIDIRLIENPIVITSYDETWE